MNFELIKTTKRLTFDIISQYGCVRNSILDNTDCYFKASNGYEIISRSRMDIQTERLWLWGTSPNICRSGSMVFSDNAKRDIAYDNFIQAIYEWNEYFHKNQKWN